jgi:uncharacterized membrane protein
MSPLNARRFIGRRSSERGAVLYLTAVFALVVVWLGAMAVDLGQDYAAESSVQSVADSAALDTAQYLNSPIPNGDTLTQFLTSEAQASAVRNGYPTSAVSAVPGCVTGPSTFVTSCSSPNAVQVTAHTKTSGIFAGPNNIAKTAAASVSSAAGFSIGSYLASFSSQDSILNDELSPLGSSGLDVSAVSYQGLANAGVSLLQLINASGGVLTPSNVMTASLTNFELETFMKAALEAQPTTTYTTNAISGLTQLLLHASTTQHIQLCQALSVNGSTCSNGTVSTSALAATGNLLQTLTYAAQVANGSSAIDLGAGLVTGVEDAKVTTTLIQPPQVEYGQSGITATTAQLSSTLTLTLATVPLVGTVSLSIPISGVEGQATLASVTCAGNVANPVLIYPATTTALSTSAGVLLNTTSLGSVPLTVPAASVSSPGLSFAPTYGESDTQSFGTTGPTFTTGGQGGITGVVWAVVAPVLNLLTSTTSPVLAPLLQDLGVSIAGATVAVTGATCTAASLVQ